MTQDPDESKVIFDIFSFLHSLLHISLVFLVLQPLSTPSQFPCPVQSLDRYLLSFYRYLRYITDKWVFTNIYYLPLWRLAKLQWIQWIFLPLLISKGSVLLTCFSFFPWTIFSLAWFCSHLWPLCKWSTKPLLLPTIPLQLNITTHLKCNALWTKFSCHWNSFSIS